MSAKTQQARSLFDPSILKPALVDSFKKLSPAHLWKNPVMFVVEVGSVLTTALWIRDLVSDVPGEAPLWFTGATTIAITGNFWLALLVAAIVVAVGGMALQATALRPLIGRDPLTTILATFGIPNRVPVPSPAPQHTAGNSTSLEHFGRVAKIAFDAAANEAYAADGYLNKRVAVLDMDTGKIKRFWGAYGNAPSDSNYGPYNPDAPLIPQFRTPVHCAEPTNDGLVYVCDRPNDRIQVFRKDGSFVKEVRIAPRTLGDGSVWDIAFSRDPQQRYLYLADGKNERIHVIERESLQILTQFGGGGRQPGQFFAVHSIATDSRGNIFTTETYDGRRVQKFVYRGMGPVSRNQGVVWPVRR